jgi:hypothetical protein
MRVPAAQDDDFPAGLPRRLDGPEAWYGPALATQSDWIEPLSPAELDELAAAASRWLPRVEQNPRALNSLTAAGFPLPTLAPRVARLREELLHGRGFVLLRGFPVARWGRRLSAVAFYGLGVHIGRPRTQNAQGHLLGHVRDLGLRSDDPNVRIYQTHERQTFHTDSADVVGLLCLQTAKSGGLSALVSSVTIYNEMRDRRPRSSRAGCSGQWLPTDAARFRRAQPPTSRSRSSIGTRACSRRSTSASTSIRRSASPTRRGLPAADIEALDLFDALTDDPALQMTMALEPGDLQFVHNHTILHDRTAFEDFPEPARRRYLLRLWLAPEGARVLPPVFAERYGSVVAGERGGIAMTNEAGVMPLPDA